MNRKTFLLLAALALFSVQSPAAERKRHAPTKANADRTRYLGGTSRPAAWVEDMTADSLAVLSVDQIARLQNIPKRTALYEIDPQAVLAGYFYHFYVRGKYGDYRVESVLELVKLCHELESLEKLRHFDPGGEFFSGVGRGVASIGIGVANLVTKPGKTLRSFGTRFGRFFRSTPKAGKTSDGVNRSHLGEGPAGPNRRRLAYKVDLDVYTDNPDVQRVLVGLSHARYTGEIATWVVPAGSVGLLSKMFRDEMTEKRIRDYSPGDLRMEAGKYLRPILAMKQKNSPLAAFLVNPNYTPRQLAYITSCFLGMKDAAGLQTIMDKLAHAQTPEEADMLYMEVRCHHRMHISGNPAKSFVPLGDAFASVGQNEVFTYIFTGDYLGRQVIDPQDFDLFLNASRGAHAVATEILSLGDVDPAILDKAGQHGIRVVPNAFIDVGDKL